MRQSRKVSKPRVAISEGHFGTLALKPNLMKVPTNLINDNGNLFFFIQELRIKCAETCKKLHEEKLNESCGARNATKEEDDRAQRAFQQFEEVYSFARDMW